MQIQENVRERDVHVIQSFTEPVSDHIMELFITLDALRSASARRVTAVIPYYSYARSGQEGRAPHLDHRPPDRRHAARPPAPTGC